MRGQYGNVCGMMGTMNHSYFFANNMGAPSSFVFSFYSDKYAEVELLDHVLVLFLQHSLFTHFHISGHLGLLSPYWIFFVSVFCEVFFLGGG